MTTPEKNCGNCRFRADVEEEYSSGPPSIRHECRKRAPVVVEHDNFEVASGLRYRGASTLFPKVELTIWCDDHEGLGPTASELFIGTIARIASSSVPLKPASEDSE